LNKLPAGVQNASPGQLLFFPGSPFIASAD